MKYGHLTISSAASWNHAFLCPPGHEAGPAFQIGEGLRPALGGRSSFWDDTGEIPRTDWSPLADTRCFVHQLRIMGKNAELLLRMFIKHDWLCLSLLLVGLSPWLAWRLRAGGEESYRILWWAAAILVYCGGYLPIHFVERYAIVVLWPLMCIGCFHFASVLLDVLKGAVWKTVLGRSVVAAILVISLTPMVGILTVQEVLVGHSNNYRAAAAGIAAAGGSGPVAGTRRPETTYFAYYLKEPYLGEPVGATPAECEEELNQAGAGTFLVWPESPFWSSFDAAPSWVLAQTVQVEGDQPNGPVRVYIRRPRP